MARMKTNVPARKVVGSTAAVALSTILIWLAKSQFGMEIPEAVEGAILTLLVFLTGYFTPPAAIDVITHRANPGLGPIS